jgi:hypothetical protein
LATGPAPVEAATIQCTKKASYHGQPATGVEGQTLAVRRVLEAAGVEFIDQNGGGTGVRLREHDPIALAVLVIGRSEETGPGVSDFCLRTPIFNAEQPGVLMGAGIKCSVQTACLSGARATNSAAYLRMWVDIDTWRPAGDVDPGGKAG